jgi:hypothetical protein
MHIVIYTVWRNSFRVKLLQSTSCAPQSSISDHMRSLLSGIKRHIRPVQSAARMTLASRDRMNIPNLALLHTERMAIRRRFLACTIQAREPHIDVYSPHHRIHNISPIQNIDVGRQPKRASRRIRHTRIGISTTLQPRARRPKRNRNIDVAKTIKE